MSRKRSTTGYELTGGTGDVNPQLFKFNPLANPVQYNPGAAAGQFYELSQSITTPLNGYQSTSQSGRATVMELLKVFIEVIALFDAAAGTQTVFTEFGALLTGPAPNNVAQAATDGFVAPRALAAWNSIRAVGEGTSESNTPPGEAMHVYDMTDGAGHGVLIASPQLSLVERVNLRGGSNFIPAGNLAIHVAFLYRFKDVPLQEYLGILQSQQVGGI